jgi:hypothetical protein
MLHKEAIEHNALELLRVLQQDSILKDFWLVGGTALALQLGHRKSDDLDFFTQQDFDTQMLLEYLESQYHFTLRYSSVNTLKGVITGTSLDFIAHKYPLAGKPFIVEGIRMLSIKDIAAMKLNAIAGDGTRVKDFIDIYFILKHYSLREILDFYTLKYTERNLLHTLKSLSWFDDIDEYAWPNMILEPDLNLSKIKAVLAKYVKSFSGNLAGLTD